MSLKITTEIPEGIHKFPSLLNLNFGGWQKIIVCDECTYTVADDDINCHQPCPNCGGSFNGMKSFTGKWNISKRKWVKKTSKIKPSTLCSDFF